MEKLLLELLETLEEIGRSHEEVYDSDCRERMGDAVFYFFIAPSPSYELPRDFGLCSDDANQQVRAALSRYVESARELAARLGLADFHARLAAFQNSDVRTSRGREQFDAFFGWSNPRCFDSSGRVVNLNPSRRLNSGNRSPLCRALDSRKIGTLFRAINRHAAIYVCLAAFFGLGWIIHYLAFLKMEICNRQFVVMNDKTLRAMALIDWVSAHSRLAIVYVFSVVASIAFLQIRGRPPWAYWLAAVLFCLPCVVYCTTCAYIANKLLGPMALK